MFLTKFNEISFNLNIDAKNMKLVSALIVAAAISYPAIRDKVLFYRKRREANRNV